MADVHAGGCLCGAVRFRAKGSPKVTTVCHCKFCQRVSGSAFSIEPWFQEENVEFEGDPPSTYDYRSPEHGRVLHVQFCARCGNRVGLLLDRFPKMQALYGGTFDDPDRVKPKWHIFT